MDFIIDSTMNAKDNRWEISVSGEIDIFNSAELKSKLTELVDEKNTDLFINCKNLDYIDSTALGALVAVLKKVKSYGGEMHLLRIKPNLLKLFKITNLDKVFIIEGDANA